MKKTLLVICGSVIAVSLVMGCNNKNTENIITKEIEKKENKTKTEENMITTDSGLKYEVLKKTDISKQPKRGERIAVHYTGWLNENGQKGAQFDSSVDRGTPFSFIVGVGQVIKGWDEALLDMNVGEKRKLFIPSKLAYGARGAGNVIPPNYDLIFEVELLEIK